MNNELSLATVAAINYTSVPQSLYYIVSYRLLFSSSSYSK